MENQSQYPYSPQVWFGQHPEKFVKKRQPARMLKNLLIALVGLIVLIFPGIIPFFKLWLIYLAALAAIGFGLAMIWVEGSAYFSISSGGEIKEVGIKKFRNSRDNSILSEILEAFRKRDFDYLAQAPGADNQPLQLITYEDKVGREFYLQMKCHTSEGFIAISDVVTVSGKEYDQNAELIRSLKTEE